MQLPLRRFQGSLHFSKQRKNLADPEYLAPFPPANIYQSLEESEDALQYSLDWKLEKTAPISADDPNHPCMYGNTLACFPCTCPSCQDSANQPTWCLLHPIGEIFDKVTLSTLCLPNGQGNAALLRLRRNMDTYQKRMGAVFNELYIGDTIRQIEHCGDKTSGIFLVRTSNYVTIFSTDPYKESYEGSRRSRRSSNQTSNAYTTGDSSYQSENTCWGVFQLTELHRLDLRSIGKHGGPSFCPLDVKSHPMFGNSALSPKFKFAILSQNSNNDRNVIHHFLWSSPPEEKDDSKESKTAPKPRHFLATKHTISNLKAISEIVFSPAHPMLMWAVAKSYIRPSLVPDYAMKTASFRQPRLGKGYSLFSIDLRTNQATFQWSPSASEFLPEGFHSLSGISVEWHNPNKKHTVWVSSVSAGKMWEIDGRLPCRVINMWTLPSQCDGIGATMPATVGLYGAGTLFAWPCTMTGNQRKASNDAHSDPPLLSVGKAPEAHGLHLYQRTNVAPKFQTQSIECAASASLHNWVGKKCSIAMSSMFALPDVSSKVFVCGLAPIRLPVSDFLTKSQISSLGCNVDRSGSLICAVTMTNQGDLYSQILLELRPDKNQETVDLNSPGDLPAGTTFIPVPQRNGEETGDARHDPFDKKAKKKLAGGMNLYVHSSNEMPLPRDRARATKEPKKETPLRPFKYSKAWKMPIWEKPGEGNTPGKGVKSKGCTDVMVNTKEKTRALDNGAAAVSILIGEGIHTQKSQLASVLECFDLDKEALVEKSTGEDYAARSDVTQDALDFAAEDWE